MYVCVQLWAGMRYDSRGRRRAEGQESGLRPLYPTLPPGWISRALRVCMPEARWREFDQLLWRVRDDAPTGPRAVGRLVMNLMEQARAGGQGHWLDWEHEKARRLLSQTHRAA